MASGSRNGQRIWRAQRDQTSWDMICLDDLLSADHRARQVWAYVEGCELSVLYEKIRAVEGGVGRAPVDPAILMALWLYATLEGVGSARLLDRLCASDAAYRWICGGVGMNYHTLSDFRVEAGAVLDDLLTRSMAGLAQAGIVDLSCLGVDGVRVFGDPVNRLPHLVCLGVDGVEAEPVLLGLDQSGIAVHSGSACSSETLEPSPVLEAMGVDADRSLRLSVGWSTTDDDLRAFETSFAEVVSQLRALRS